MVKERIEQRPVSVWTCEGCGMEGTDRTAIKAHEWDSCDWPFRKVAPFPPGRIPGGIKVKE